jgi:chemotaxis protein histidine kinase CheA
MDNFADTLWHEFAAETEEHLLAVEPILSQADEQRTNAADIGQLFRSFHSIKGLARAMDILGMESVAHHAENLLGLVREGQAALTADITDLLLQSVDSLKQLRETAVQQRRDSPASPEFVARLAEAFARYRGTAVDAVAAPSAVPGGAGGDTPLHEDTEMLEIFVEMVRGRAPELCDALAADMAARATAIDAAEMLTHAAEVMNFDALAETFGGLRDVLVSPSCAGPLDDATRQDLLARLGDIRLQIELVGEISGEDAGTAEFAGALSARIGDERARLAESVRDSNRRLREALADGDHLAAEADAASVTQLSRTLYGMMAALSLPRAAETVLLIEDLYGRISGGETDVPEMLLEAADELFAAIAAQARSGIIEDFSEEQAGAFTTRLRDPSSSTVQQLLQAEGDGRLVAGIAISAELLAVLSDENLAELERGIGDGLVPYAILVHLEADPQIGEHLIGWLTGDARSLTNRTVISDGESWFEFLTLSSLEPAALSTVLSSLDPGRRCVKAVRRLTPAPSGVAVVGATDGPTTDPQAAAHAGPSSNLIRVRGEVVDSFLDEIGELRVMIERLTHLIRGAGSRNTLNRVQGFAERLPRELRGDLLGSLQDLRDRDRGLLETEELISGLLSRLHQSALELRVVPIDLVFNRMPRLVRDLAHRQGKSVDLVLEGRDVRIDKSMVDALADPLIHMVRNAVDHGIEPAAEREAAGKSSRAQLTLRAAQRGSEIHIEVNDDGRGLDAAGIREKAVARGVITHGQAAALPDAEIYQFIFEAGLSTAAAVTETSGRGVGMDIVLATVRRLNGDITIRSVPGKGATFTLILPVSAALQTALIVRVGAQSLAIPDRHVMAVAEIEAESVHLVGMQRSVIHRDAVLPLYDLGTLLGMPNGTPPANRPLEPIVVTTNGRHMIGLEVDTIEQRLELLLKDLDPRLARFPGVGGASVLGDGRVVLVLDGDELIQLAAHGIERPNGAAAALPVS